MVGLYSFYQFSLLNFSFPSPTPPTPPRPGEPLKALERKRKRNASITTRSPDYGKSEILLLPPPSPTLPRETMRSSLLSLLSSTCLISTTRRALAPALVLDLVPPPIAFRPNLGLGLCHSPDRRRRCLLSRRRRGCRQLRLFFLPLLLIPLLNFVADGLLVAVVPPLGRWRSRIAYWSTEGRL